MAIAKVELSDLNEYEREIETFIGVLQETQGKIDTLEKADNDIRKEIDEYEQVSKKCDQIISELNDKLRQLETKERRLEQEIKVLKVEIQAAKAEVAALSAEWVVAPLKAKGAVATQLRQAKENLDKLEKKLDQTEKELERTKRNIETAKSLISQSEQKQSQIRDGINSLNEASESLRNTINELNDLLQKLTSDSRRASENLSKSDEYINRYLEISIDNVTYKPRDGVRLKRCTNLSFAGGTYDYHASKDDEGNFFTEEKVQYFQEKYPDIKYSEVDSYGNTYPDFTRFEKFSYKFPPVTKENLANGTCLIGDSKGGSADFKKFREAMENAGYSKQQIAELLSTHTIHHDEDGCTLRLIPRDVHKACRHNGGAEKIRLQIAML